MLSLFQRASGSGGGERSASHGERASGRLNRRSPRGDMRESSHIEQMTDEYPGTHVLGSKIL